MAELANLTPLEAEILDHWNQANPEMVKELQSQGTLRKTLKSKAQLARKAYSQAISQGLAADQARELTREIWMVQSPPLPDLPDHESQPTTDPD